MKVNAIHETRGPRGNLPRSQADRRRQLHPSVVATTALLLTLVGCASTSAPGPGRALLDARPDSQPRERIHGIRLVSVNGRPQTGTTTLLPPGRNDVGLRFDWPQGGSRTVDLRFDARPGLTYFVKCEPFPPTHRAGEPTGAAKAAGSVLEFVAPAREGALLALPLLAPLWGADVATRVAHQSAQESKPVEYVDVMVIARYSPDGIVRRVRVWPDGRVDDSTWGGHPRSE